MDKEIYEQYQMQGDMQRQAGEMQMSAVAPQMHEQVAQAQAVLVEQTNPDRVLEDITLKLKGQIRNIDGTVTQLGKPLMNQKGVDRMLFIMSSIINQNTILSHLEDDEISKVMVQLGDDITDDLTLNWKDYGIGDKMLLDHIEDSILIPAYFALKRALGQNEKNWLGKITVENISGSRQFNAPKKEGLLSKFRL